MNKASLAQQGVSICVVTYNDASDLKEMFASVTALDHQPVELTLVDCASADASVETARDHWPKGLAGSVVPLSENLGFAGGMNVAISQSQYPFILTLNADARPQPSFVTHLLTALQDHHHAGAATGRLLRFRDPDGEGNAQRIDACGMHLVPAWRHLDRGSGEVDVGQFQHSARVFGGTGAATLFRRHALDDVALGDFSGPATDQGHLVFAPEFHSFREDAELAFRLQERGWCCVYEPRAVAFHRRTNLPQRRSQMPPYVNYHSLKNRYLLRAYHQTVGNAWKTLFPTLLRDVGALLYVILRERGSLRAYSWLLQHRKQISERRRFIQGRRQTSAETLDRWFFEDEVVLDTPSGRPR